MSVKHVMVGAAVLVVMGAGALSAQQPAAAAQTPAQLYTANCAVCHGATGTPAAGMVRSMGAMPDFATVVAPADSVWVRAITAGKGKMPAMGGRLTPAQVHSLVTYLRTLKK
ncbi:MAG: cytochrome c [Gemmatimonadales bacterium]|jgi:mono/diheme cytochrome c family protein